MSNNNPADFVRRSIIKKQGLEDYQVLDYGKLPPQARDLEEAVLAAIMLEPVFPLAARIIKTSECFYVDAHQRIYKAMIELFSLNMPIDLLTVTERLRYNQDLEAAGGAYYVSQLTNKIGTAANVEAHAFILKERYMKRKCISMGTEIVRDAYEDHNDAFDVLQKLVRESSDLLSDVSSAGEKPFIEAVSDFERSYDETEEPEFGLHTGIDALDNLTLGWSKADTIIIAARPGWGKTTLLLQSIRKNCRAGRAIGVFSYEMTRAQLILKLASMEAKVDMEKIRRKTMDTDEYRRFKMALKEIKTWKLHVYDNPSADIVEVEAVSTGWVKKEGVQGIFIDYIQLIPQVQVNGRWGENREQHISAVSRAIKKAAMALNIPFIIISQMSRAIEDLKTPRRPVNSDLRESGSLEQDASMILFLYRPDQQGIERYEDGLSTQNIVEMILTKSRLGKKGTILAKFVGELNFFDEIRRGGAGESYENKKEAKKEGFKRTEGPVSSQEDEDLPF